MLSPSLKLHLFKTFVAPIARSGLSSMTLSSKHINPLTIFHRKILRGFLGLSDSAAVPSLYFLTGELPLHAAIHKDVFSLFYNVWSNPQTKIHEIVKYLLENSPKNSHTWSRNIRNLAQIYNIEDPLILIKQAPPSKTEFSEYVKTKITVHFEKHFRSLASKNSKMQFLNIELKGLNGRPHPVISETRTTKQVRKSCSHIKLLCDDVYTFERKAKYDGGSANCRLCFNDQLEENHNENVIHIIATCSAYAELRGRIKCEIESVCANILPLCLIHEIIVSPKSFTQFILDCTSHNLPVRIDPSLDIFLTIMDLSRDLCFGILKLRSEMLKALKK